MAEALSEDHTFADAVSSPDEAMSCSYQTTSSTNQAKGSTNQAIGGVAEAQTVEPHQTDQHPGVLSLSTRESHDQGKTDESEKVPKDGSEFKPRISIPQLKVTIHRRTSSSSSGSQRRSREEIFTADIDTTSLLASTATSSMGISGPHEDDARARNRRLQSKLSCCGLCHCLTAKRCVIGSALTALVLIVLAVIMYGVAIPRFHYHIKQRAILRESQSQDWLKPTGPALLTFYFFNVTNRDEFHQGLEPPMVEEKGPYVIRVTMEKVNVTWNDNFTVTYEDNHSFEFVQSLSNGTMNDTIVTSKTMQSTDVKLRLAQEMVSLGLDERVTGVLAVHTVGELFRWYQDQDQALKLSDHSNDVNDLRFTLLYSQDDENATGSLHIDMSNRTYGVMNVYTGENNFSRFNEFYSWDYETFIAEWTSDEARALRGTDGYMFNPFVDVTSELTIFDPDLFRTFDLEFKERTTFKGASVLRFIIPDSELSNGTAVDNRTRLEEGRSRRMSRDHVVNETSPHSGNSMGGFGSEKTNKGSGYCTPTCVPSGVYSVTAFTGGGPFYISLPHFLGADPFYTNNIVGLKPDESRHRPYFDVHVLTGHVLYQRRSHQFIERLAPPNAPEVYLPLYWSEPSVEASDSTLRTAKDFHLTNSALYTFLYCLLAAVGLAVFHLITVGGCRMRMMFFTTYNPIPEPPPSRPPCYCCCHCSPCYKEFTYCMFRLCADD